MRGYIHDNLVCDVISNYNKHAKEKWMHILNTLQNSFLRASSSVRISN